LGAVATRTLRRTSRRLRTNAVARRSIGERRDIADTPSAAEPQTHRADLRVDQDGRRAAANALQGPRTNAARRVRRRCCLRPVTNREVAEVRGVSAANAAGAGRRRTARAPGRANGTSEQPGTGTGAGREQGAHQRPASRKTSALRALVLGPGVFSFGRVFHKRPLAAPSASRRLHSTSRERRACLGRTRVR
jgi:hypothetical protein